MNGITTFCLDHRGSESLHSAICDRLIELEIMAPNKRPEFAECWPYIVVLDGEYSNQGTIKYVVQLPEVVEEASLEDLYTKCAYVYVFQIGESTHYLSREEVVTIRDAMTDVLEE